ncbi:MAG TPA: hypothetical protein VKE70_26955 [Candidatus Solibacter sp.]|nr:hypothetical protein [Candidatus Solibacter sp.]
MEPEPEFPNRSMQFLTRAFGPVENRQVISPVVESQLRRRHQFRIDELSNLGFSYLCCYSESFPAGRLLFGIPLVIVFFMFAGREYIRLRDRRIHIYCRLMLSRDCSTYADLTGRGVKFYTTFSDRTCIITSQYSGADYNSPRVTKRYIDANINETWTAHRAVIDAREASGTRAVRQTSFADFERISDLERAAGI